MKISELFEDDLTDRIDHVAKGIATKVKARGEANLQTIELPEVSAHMIAALQLGTGKTVNKIKDLLYHKIQDYLHESKYAPPTTSRTFQKITWEQFEQLCPGTDDYEETEIDGKCVEGAFDGANCIGMYYQKAKIGSKCLSF